MKKIILICCAVLCLSLFSACGNEESSIQSESESPSENAASSASIPEPESEKEDPAPDSGSRADSSESASESDAEKVPDAPVDYQNTDYSDWLYTRRTDDSTSEILVYIDTLEHGKAGASLDAAQAAAGMIRLTQAPDAEEQLKNYLGGMNALQLDYFSFQWKYTFSFAHDILDAPDIFSGVLSDAGTDLKDGVYSAGDLDRLGEKAEELFASLGVKNIWRNHTDMEPFCSYFE